MSRQTALPLILSKPAPRARSGGVWNEIASAIVRSASGRIGLVLVLLMVFVAVFADQIAPFPPQYGDLMASKLPPAWVEGGSPAHLFGTDQLGQDVFSRVVHGSRVSLTVGFFGVILATLIGVTAGLAAGYFRGGVDVAVTSVSNLMLSIPYLVFVTVIATIFGRSLLNVILIFGITNAPIFARVTRAETLRVTSREFFTAARSMGAGHRRMLLAHVLPNLIGPIVTLATFEMSAMIFYEAGLSFIGLSVPPEVPSWGNMLSLGRRFLNIYPWIAIFPALAIALTALGVNLLGEALRSALDPKARRSLG